MFSNTSVMLYVFDIDEQEEKVKESLDHFVQALQALNKYSPDADVFVLIHKIDLIEMHKRKEWIQRKKETIDTIACL